MRSCSRRSHTAPTPSPRSRRRSRPTPRCSWPRRRCWEALKAFRDGGVSGGQDFKGWHPKYDKAITLAREALALAEPEDDGEGYNTLAESQARAAAPPPPIQVTLDADDWELYSRMQRVDAAKRLSMAVGCAINSAQSAADAWLMVQGILLTFDEWGANDTEGRAVARRLITQRFGEWSPT
jgi:hypothetical protein